MSQHYFTKSGEYNFRDKLPDDATDWMIIPTDHWTLHMWEIIWNIDDDKRYSMAEHFSINVHRLSNGKCKVCKLNAEQLDGQWLVGQEISVDYDGWATNVSELAEQGIL
jgi:hypothetical protein